MSGQPATQPECMVIAEVGQAHDGSLGNAHAFIDAAANAGADAIKFQTHLASAESTPDEPWRVHFSRQDATRLDYWKRMEFTESEWMGLREHADDSGLAFLSSPFSLEAVELLERVGVSAWKIASGEVGNDALLDRVVRAGQPVILSSGMSPMEELDRAAKRIQHAQLPLTVLQCTSSYPCPPERVGLNVIPQLRDRYRCGVGLSDHSGTIYAGLAAATLGIDVLEVHITFSREMFGPDVVASLTTDELRALVDGVRFIERMRANPVDKDGLANEMTPLRELFTKSIVAARPLDPGTTLTRPDIAVKKPGTGLPPEQLNQVLGRRITRRLHVDEQLRVEDLEAP